MQQMPKKFLQRSNLVTLLLKGEPPEVSLITPNTDSHEADGCPHTMGLGLTFFAAGWSLLMAQSEADTCWLVSTDSASSEEKEAELVLGTDIVEERSCLVVEMVGTGGLDCVVAVRGGAGGSSSPPSGSVISPTCTDTVATNSP